MVTEIQLFDSPYLTPLDFCLWGWVKSEVYERNMNTRDELLSRILDSVPRTKKHEDQLRRTTRYLRTQLFLSCLKESSIFSTDCREMLEYEISPTFVRPSGGERFVPWAQIDGQTRQRY